MEVGDLVRITESHWSLSADGRTMVLIVTPPYFGDLEPNQLAAKYLAPNPNWGSATLVVHRDKIEKV